MQQEAVWIGWTTVATAEDARRLADGLIDERLAACVQISGPVESVYRWEGAVDHATEFRLAVKFASSRAVAIEQWMKRHHPYETPQWLCVPAIAGAEKYLNWVIENST